MASQQAEILFRLVDNISVTVVWRQIIQTLVTGFHLLQICCGTPSPHLLVCSGSYLLLLSVWSFFVGNPEKLREMILSIPDHISNTHSFPSNTYHKYCQHEPLTGERSKAWLARDSVSLQKIRSAVLGKDNCRVADLPHMVGFSHTGSIGILLSVMIWHCKIEKNIFSESWNSLHNNYCSKNYYYRCTFLIYN